MAECTGRVTLRRRMFLRDDIRHPPVEHRRRWGGRLQEQIELSGANADRLAMSDLIGVDLA